MNGVKFELSSHISSSGSRLLISETDISKMIDPILKPHFIPNARSFNTVIIDPGHGGVDAGAVNKSGTEARYNLNVARTLQAGLKAKGFKVIMTIKQRSGNYQDSANIALATAIHGCIKERVEKYNVPDRGIKRARFSVLSSIKNPAILVEGGFMSNPSEARLIESTVYQSTIATAIYEGIFKYRYALNSRK